MAWVLPPVLCSSVATGYTYVNSQEIKKQILPGLLVIREVNGPHHVRSCYCLFSVSIFLVLDVQVKANAWTATAVQPCNYIFHPCSCNLLIAFWCLKTQVWILSVQCYHTGATLMYLAKKANCGDVHCVLLTLAASPGRCCSDWGFSAPILS